MTMKKLMLLFALCPLMVMADNWNTGSGSLPGKVNKISITWMSGRVDIRPTNANEISWQETFRKGEDQIPRRMQYKKEGDELKIRFSKDYTGSLLDNVVKDLIVYVPSSWNLDEIQVGQISGDTYVADIQTDLMTVASVSGDITVSANCLKSGLATVSGKVECTMAKRCDKCDVESVSGNVMVKLVPNKGADIEHDSVSGRFSSKYEGRFHGDHFIIGDASVELKIETVSGNISIK